MLSYGMPWRWWAPTFWMLCSEVSRCLMGNACGWQQLVWRGTGLSSSPQEIWYEISAEHLSKGTPPEELASATYVLQGNRIIPFLIVEKIRGGLALKAALQLRLRGIQWCLSQLCFLVLLVRRNVSTKRTFGTIGIWGMAGTFCLLLCLWWAHCGLALPSPIALLEWQFHGVPTADVERSSLCSAK